MSDDRGVVGPHGFLGGDCDGATEGTTTIRDPRRNDPEKGISEIIGLFGKAFAG